MLRSLRGSARRKPERQPKSRQGRSVAVVSEALEARRLLTAVVVNTTVDALFPPVTGFVSLRNAIATASASSSTTITFDPKVFATAQTITLNGNQLELGGSGTTTLTPPIAGLTINGNKQSGVFQVDSGVTATFSGLSITNGNSQNPGGGILNYGFLILNNVNVSGNTSSQYGGGISNRYGNGKLILNHSTVSNNSSTGSGGIDDNNNSSLALNDVTVSNNHGGTVGGVEVYSATATLNDVTIFGNVASNLAGGLGVDSGGIANLVNVTVSGNSSGGYGGGILNSSGTLTLNSVSVSDNSAKYGGGVYNGSNSPTISNTVIAGNIATSGGSSPDVAGNYNSLGYNLIGKTDGSTGFNGADLTGTVAKPLNAKLGALANNGGFTQTLLPLPGSPAIDHGLNAFIPKGITTDQRGLARIVNGTVDIGAVEVQSTVVVASIKLTAPANQTATVGVPATVQLGSFTQVGATGPFKVDVAWGDGSADSILTVAAAGTIPATAHTFAKAGSFTVSETVTDAKSVASNKVTFKETVSAPTTGTVSGQVFGDLNGNGKLDGKEVGLAGWIVYVDANNNGQFDPTEQYALTDSKGNYALALKAGTYTLRAQVRSGYYETAPHALFYKVTVIAGKAIVGDTFGERIIAPA